MGTISNQNLNQIIIKTLSLMNADIIEHGEVTGYILYNMLKYEGQYDEQELIDYLMIGILHDIGRYHDENKNDIFSQSNPWEHSIYGFLFLKYLSPIGDKAEIILYHHLYYKRYKLVKMKYRHVTECLALANQMDHFLKKRNPDMEPDYFVRYRNIRFSGAALDLFFQAEKSLGFMAKLASGEYKQEMSEILSKKFFTEAYRRGFLEMLVYTIDYRSETTVVHTRSTVFFAQQLARLMGLSAKETNTLSYGALLHDLGKIVIPLDILEAPGRLTDEQMRIMRGHVQITERILEGLVDDEVLQIAIRHHEKLDGSGYHRGLTEKDLTLSQQIVAVADILSALYGKRSYKDSFSSDTIKKILTADADNHKISKPVVDCLLRNYDTVLGNYEEEKNSIFGVYYTIKEQTVEIMKNFENL